MKPATTAAVESTATVESSAITTTDEAVRVTSAVSAPIAAVTATAVVAAMSIVSAAAIVAVAVVATVEPGAGADEDSTDEVIRPVVAVWRTGVRIVAIVTIGANRRRADGAVDRAHPNSNTYLGVGAARGKK